MRQSMATLFAVIKGIFRNRNDLESANPKFTTLYVGPLGTTPGCHGYDGCPTHSFILANLVADELVTSFKIIFKC